MTEEHLNESFGQLFDDLLHNRVDRLAAEPEDTEALVEAVTLYHMIIEGALALTGQHFIIEYNTEQETLPAFVEGFNKVARDEHRHIAFGVRFLTDMAREDDRYRQAIQRMMGEALPIADGVLDPPWAEEDDWELFGYSRDRDARLRRPVPHAANEGDRARLGADRWGPSRRPCTTRCPCRWAGGPCPGEE